MCVRREFLQLVFGSAYLLIKRSSAVGVFAFLVVVRVLVRVSVKVLKGCGCSKKLYAILLFVLCGFVLRIILLHYFIQ